MDRGDARDQRRSASSSMDRIPSLSWSEPAAEHHALNRRRQVRQTTRHIRRHHVLDENPEGLRKTGHKRRETSYGLPSLVSCLLSPSQSRGVGASECGTKHLRHRASYLSLAPTSTRSSDSTVRCE